MANSTYRSIVNRILQQAGQATIDSDNTFNDNTLLDKAQVQAKVFTDLINRRMVSSLRARFLRRQFTITTSSSSNSSSVDSTVAPEKIISGSMFITTSGYGRGPLEYLPYDTWLSWFPEGETVKGIPKYWLLLPPDGTNTDHIAFSPPPNGTYSIKYEAYLKPVALSAASDTIAWPVEHEHVLIVAGQTFLEMALSEGKMQDIGQFMEPFISEMKQLTLGPDDETPKVDIGMRFNSTPVRGIRSVRGSA